VGKESFRFIQWVGHSISSSSDLVLPDLCYTGGVGSGGSKVVNCLFGSSSFLVWSGVLGRRSGDEGRLVFRDGSFFLFGLWYRLLFW
jgi:hypothetical protein